MTSIAKHRAAAVLVALVFASAACTKSPDAAPHEQDDGGAASASAPPESASATPATSALESAPPAPEKLTVEDIAIGKGPEAKIRDHISIHYVASIAETGKEFDSSRARNQPFELDLGTRRVIRGWDQGMIGMRVGGKRKVTIPPSFGYGLAGAPPLIPPKSTLVYEIELLSLTAKK